MKTVVFVACILAAVSADNILSHIMKMSNMFNVLELLDYHTTLEKCALKFGVLDIVTPETMYCVSQEKNLLDEKGGMNWNEAIIYGKKIIHDSNLTDKMVKSIHECRKARKTKRDKVKKSKYEETLKFLECFAPFVNHILKELVPYHNNI